MTNQPDTRELFLKAQCSVGITRQNFARRFLYNPNYTTDNYLVDKLTPSPSQLRGFTIEQEKSIGYLITQMIFRAGQALKLPVSTTVLAVSITHQFYSRTSLLDHDFRDTILGAVFLACKSEQTLRKSFEVALVFDHIFKIFEGQKPPIKVLTLESNQYEFMKTKVLKMQNEILFQLGFEVYRLFDIPHRYIGGLLKSLEKHSRCKQICQKAWTFLNDFYRTSCCLFYPGQAIAAAALYMSLLKLQIPMPTVPWWILIQANLESIQQLVGEFQAFYEIEAGGKYSLEWVSAQIGGVAEKNGLVNVCPVNYYRKIILEQQQQLSIRYTAPHLKEQQQQPQKPQEDPQLREESRSSENKNGKKQKKKKDKKDKKKKKDRRNSDQNSQDRSRSRDRENKHRHKHSDRSPTPNHLQIADNDQTPKIKPAEKLATVQPSLEVASSEKKEVVKQMKLGSAKGLLSQISTQLRKHSQARKQQQQQQASSDSDEELLAELIQIKKSNANKSTQRNKQ